MKNRLLKICKIWRIRLTKLGHKPNLAKAFRLKREEFEPGEWKNKRLFLLCFLKLCQPY